MYVERGVGLNSKFVLKCLLGLFVVIGAVYAFKAYGPFRGSRPSGAIGTGSDPYLASLEKDKRVLDQALSGRALDGADVIGALVRLSEVRWPASLELALRWTKDEVVAHREAAAQALGHFDEKSATKALADLLADPIASVRESALHAVGETPTATGRRELLAQAAVPGKASPAEEIARLESEYRLSAEGDKEKVLQKLLQLGKTGGGEAASLAALKLVELAPHWDQTVFLARSKIEGRADVGTVAAEIRYLAGKRDPWLKDRWPALAKSGDPAVRKAVIQSLHRSCPANRQTLLTEIARAENDPTVQDVVIQETNLLAENWGPNVFAALRPRVKDARLLAELKETDETSAKPRPPCAGSEKETDSRQQ